MSLAKASSAVKNPHSYKDTSFRGPVWCTGNCSKFIWGATNQGKECRQCGLTIHHRCLDPSMAKECSATPIPEPVKSTLHFFVEKTFPKPTYCTGSCGKFIWGAFNQGRECYYCKKTIHHKCLADAVAIQCAAPHDANPPSRLMDERTTLGVDLLQMKTVQGFIGGAAASHRVYPTDRSKLTQEQLEDLKASFDLLDVDGSGAIDKNEISAFMQTLGMASTPEQLNAIFEQIDANGNGTIDFEEYQVMMCSTSFKVDAIQELRLAFQAMDKDGDGAITAPDLIKFMSVNLNTPTTPEQASLMIQATDGDGDGKVSWLDFTGAMGLKIDPNSSLADYQPKKLVQQIKGANVAPPSSATSEKAPASGKASAGGATLQQVDASLPPPAYARK